MAFEPKENQGYIYVGENAGKVAESGGNYPDREGYFIMNNERYKVSGWLGEGAKGPYLKINITTPEEQAKFKKADAPAAQAPPTNNKLPF